MGRQQRGFSTPRTRCPCFYCSKWFRYDHLARLTNVTSAAGTFRYSYLAGASAQVQELELPSVWDADESTDYDLYLTHAYDALARLTGTMLHNQYYNVLNQHEYQVNAANQRTRQTFTGGNYVDYTYDNIGQLKTAKGWEADRANCFRETSH